MRANAQKKCCTFGAVTLSGLFAMIPLGGAGAHGAVSMENDICKLKVASYFMHFAGYQPDRSITEFCEDIPMTGRTIIVLDFIDDALRDMPAAVQIMRQDKSGSRDPDAAAAGPAVLDLPARKYPNGTITLNVAFKDAGNYMGIVTVGDGSEYTASFPFSVGVNRSWYQIALWSMGVIASAVLLFFWAMRHRAHTIAANGAEEI
jgi:hypothetical protein